jgi:phospholipid/cholesterol/gamma-HCH transport system substrate-binding protein
LPNQRQIRWAELRVGLVVLFASITLAVLIFLMTGATGIFTRKITLFAYFDNAEGLRVGAPVRLAGVDIGNVTDIRVVPSRLETPVQATMRVNTRYQDALRTSSVATLSTAGVLGETFVDILTPPPTPGAPLGEVLQNNAVLSTRESPALQDVVRASQSTLQNVEVLVRRVDRIISQIESGKGTIGQFIYDEALYRRLNAMVGDVNAIVNRINSGQGTIGKLVVSDELFNQANTAVAKLNAIVDSIEQGEGTAGKLIKDPTLYNNANATIAKADRLMADINSGKGPVGKLIRDEELARRLDTAITQLSEITAKINSGQGTLGQLMVDPSVYNNTNQMLVETRNLVQAIRQNPRRYLTIHFRIF